ncbi:MAG: hypothetical protein N2260_03465 [Syntrophobacterales bacterium]|nr:hypothetical protein [Syntrophobacterales bacterium]
MLFDPEEGLYVFEVTVGYRASGITRFSSPILVQADDEEEAEEKVLEYLADMDLEGKFWVEEMSEPFKIKEYEQQLKDEDIPPYPLLSELTEEGFMELLSE